MSIQEIDELSWIDKKLAFIAGAAVSADWKPGEDERAGLVVLIGDIRKRLQGLAGERPL